MDIVAGVAWIVIYFISLQMAFIDSTAQQCSSCPALNNNIGGLPPPSLLRPPSLVKLHLCMTLGVCFPVLAVHMCWEHRANSLMALMWGGGGGASIYLPQRVDQLLKAE